MSLKELLVSRVKDVMYYLRTGSIVETTELTLDPEPRSYDYDDDPIDDKPDCTGRIHRSYCRHFNREIRELYWIPWDEVDQEGQYLMTFGGFHVPQMITVIRNEDGRLVQLIFHPADEKPKFVDINQTAVYLGPIPKIHPSLLPKEW